MKKKVLALAFFLSGLFTLNLAYESSPWANVNERTIEGVLECQSTGIVLGTTCRVGGVEFDAPGVFVTSRLAGAEGSRVIATIREPAPLLSPYAVRVEADSGDVLTYRAAKAQSLVIAALMTIPSVLFFLAVIGVLRTVRENDPRAREKSDSQES